MEYRALGSTGIKVSRIVLGCGNFGGIGSAPEFFGMGEDAREAFAVLDAAWDMGVTTLDTANAYGGGRSEATIGRWLAGKGPEVRDQVVLSSKVFNPVGPGPNDRGLSWRHVLRQVDASLGRLGVERLDLYLMHEPDPETPLAETLEALGDLVRWGKVDYLGASNVEAWRLARALWLSDRAGLPSFGWVQNSYSLLDRAAEQEVLPLCEHLGLGFTPFSPLAGGWLAGRYVRGEAPPEGSRMTLRPEPYLELQREETFDRLEALARLAAERGVSMPGLALAWLLAHPRVDAVVVGPRSPAQLVPAREALEHPLSPAEREEVSALFPTR
jgi:aryl-alcohol dehydrogenase-like predicted oxidoreductase